MHPQTTRAAPCTHAAAHDTHARARARTRTLASGASSIVAASYTCRWLAPSGCVTYTMRKPSSSPEGAARCGVWCGVWRGVVWRGVVCGAVWCGDAWWGAVRCVCVRRSSSCARTKNGAEQPAQSACLAAAAAALLANTAEKNCARSTAVARSPEPVCWGGGEAACCCVLSVASARAAVHLARTPSLVGPCPWCPRLISAPVRGDCWPDVR
jgi:hypothetical protein